MIRSPRTAGLAGWAGARAPDAARRPCRRESRRGDYQRFCSFAFLRPLAFGRGELTQHTPLLTNPFGIRRVDPTHRRRGGRVAEGGGLLMRWVPSRRVLPRPGK